MSYKTKLCVYMSFNIKRHEYKRNFLMSAHNPPPERRWNQYWGSKTDLHCWLVIVDGVPTSMTRGQGLNSRFSTIVRRRGQLWTVIHTVFSFNFFFLRGMCPCGPIPLSPLEWISSPPLVIAVLSTTKGDESPGSSRMGVIGALVIFFFPSEAVHDKLHSPWPAQ